MSLVIHKMLDEAEVPLGNSLEDRITLLLADYQRLLKMTREQSRLTDRERLLARLEEDPCETLLLLADACQDKEGREEEAKGWGWLAMHGYYPARSGQRQWVWQAADPDSRFEDTSCCLPPELYYRISGHYLSARAALEVVVAVIASGFQP